MVRVTNAVASRKRRKRLLKRAKGFFGDRKNHTKLSQDAVMKALSYNYIHRKKKKGDFRSLWIIRINTAARLCGLSYSKFINGLLKADVKIDRKMLADLAVKDFEGFTAVDDKAKAALA